MDPWLGTEVRTTTGVELDSVLGCVQSRVQGRISGSITSTPAAREPCGGFRLVLGHLDVCAWSPGVAQQAPVTASSNSHSIRTERRSAS